MRPLRGLVVIQAVYGLHALQSRLYRVGQELIRLLKVHVKIRVRPYRHRAYRADEGYRLERREPLGRLVQTVALVQDVIERPFYTLNISFFEQLGGDVGAVDMTL